MGVEPMWAPSPEWVERANLDPLPAVVARPSRARSAPTTSCGAGRWTTWTGSGPRWSSSRSAGRHPAPPWLSAGCRGPLVPEATLNHAELSLRRHHPALLFGSEAGELGTIGYAELGRRVAAAAEGLRRRGVAKGTWSSPTCPTCPRP